MKKIFATFLSLIILLSSFNFSLNAHYCCDQLVDFGILTKAETCSPNSDKSTSFERKKCCEDRNFEIEGEEHFSQKNSTKKDNITSEVSVIKDVFILQSQVSNPCIVKVYSGPPPLEIRPKYFILFENFLI